MYLQHRTVGRGVGLSGPDDPPAHLQEALKIIGKVLALNPKGGYVKGSPHRSQLDAVFQSVDDCLALDLAKHLLDSQATVARLFRHRLHRATIAAMIMILAKKARACQQRAREALRRREEEFRRQDEQRRREIEALTQRICARVEKVDRAVAEICRRAGESSGACLTGRSDLAKLRADTRGTCGAGK
jgi:hypothetical protein